jgi:hypothetical protein
LRDLSAWTVNPYEGKPIISIEASGRYPDFKWRVGSTNYVMRDPVSNVVDFGETWGDDPATITETRERGLPTRYQHGGFAIAGDSLTLDNGNILRITSFPALNITNRTNDIAYKYITQISHLITSDGLSFTNPPQPRSGIGVAKQGSNAARFFFFRATDGKLMYRDYSVGSGFNSTFQYSNSPNFNNPGNAVAPISGTEGYVISYDPTSYQTTLRYFNGSTWTSTVVSRIKQHYLNCHWFDAEPLNATERLITFNINGVQYATIGTSSGIIDPWKVFAFDSEFGSVQTRICKLTKVNNRIIATAWSRFAGGSGEYEVSYYHLLWTDDGYNWAFPEDGFIGKQSSRGKLHTVGSSAIIVGSSVSYIGKAVKWLGGTVDIQSTVASNVTRENIVQGVDKASDIKLPTLLANNFDSSLLTYGNEINLKIKYVGESTDVNIETFTLDTPNKVIVNNKHEMQVVARGPLKKLIGYVTPFDMTIEGPMNYYSDFSSGQLYARSGKWNTDENQKVGYCDKHDGSNAIATVGLEYSGQFQLSTRVRITEDITGSEAHVLFWYEGLQDYYKVVLNTSNNIKLFQVINGQNTEISSSAIPGGFLVDKWYDIIIRYVRNILKIYIKPDGGTWSNPITVSSWTHPEPQRWYSGVGCVIPSTSLSTSLERDVNHKISVASTSNFSSSGDLNINGERIYYSNKSETFFGSGAAGSIIRGIGTNRSAHPEKSTVLAYNRRFEVGFFSVFQDGRPMSVFDVCNYITTITGVKSKAKLLVNNSQSGIRIFPNMNSHNWVFKGTYNTGITLYFWTSKLNSSGIPKSGYKVVLNTTSATLSNVSDSVVINSQPISIGSSGSFQVRTENDGIFIWTNGVLACGIDIPKSDTFKVGTIACGADITNITAHQLFEPPESVVWAMQDTARNVIAKLLEGRDAYLAESNNEIRITNLENGDNAGILTGQYFTQYQQISADQDWASAMVAWGGEDWILIMEPTADRLRWVQWQTPHIYDKNLLREKGMKKLRKLWASKDLRTVEGPFNPLFEVGDQVEVTEICSIPVGKYNIISMEILGNNSMLRMKMTLRRIPDEINVANWPILPGIDLPSSQ